MNMVFLCRFESVGGDQSAIHAQLTIGEQKGKWFVMWEMTDREGHAQLETWYEGEAWDEMLQAFRQGVAKQTSSGFRPIIEWHQGTTKIRLCDLADYYTTQHVNEQTLEQLRTWRRELAQAEKKAPYLVATNRELRRLASFHPKSDEELRLVPGFGNYKAERYGKSILQITSAGKSPGPFPLHWLEELNESPEFLRWLSQQQLEREQRKRQEQLMKDILNSLIREGQSLSTMETALAKSRRDVLLLLETWQRAGGHLEKWLPVALEEVPQEWQKAAVKGFAAKGYRYLKPVYEQMPAIEGVADEKEAAELAYGWLRLLRMDYRIQQTESAEKSA